MPIDTENLSNELEKQLKAAESLAAEARQQLQSLQQSINNIGKTTETTASKIFNNISKYITPSWREFGDVVSKTFLGFGIIDGANAKLIQQREILVDIEKRKKSILEQQESATKEKELLGIANTELKNQAEILKELFGLYKNNQGVVYDILDPKTISGTGVRDLDQFAKFSEKLTDEQKKQLENYKDRFGIKEKDLSISQETLKVMQTEYQTLVKNKVKNEDINTQLQARLDALQEISDELDKQKKSSENIIEKLKKQIELALTFNNLIKLSVEAYNKFDKTVVELGKSQGVLRTEQIKQFEIAQEYASSLDRQLVTTKNLSEAIGDINKTFGTLAGKAMPDAAARVAEMSALLGISNTEAIEFLQTLAEIGNTSFQTQQNMIAVAEAAAQANGVPLGTLIKDVATKSAAVRETFRGNTAELVKQAAEVRKLGSALDAAAKSAEALLDFESSVSSELKASALTGTNLNFQAARRAAFAGDYVAQEKAILAEVSKIGDFEKQNIFVKKAIAEATGKSVAELEKMYSVQKTLNEARAKDPKFAAEMEAAQKRLNALRGSPADQKRRAEELAKIEEANKTRAMLFDEAKLQMMIALGKAFEPLANILTKLFIALSKIVTYATASGEQFAAFAAIAIASLAGLGFAFVGLKKLAGSALGLLRFKGLGEKLGKITDVIGKLKTTSAATTPVINSLGAGMGNFMASLGKGVQYSLVLLSLGAAILMIGQGMKLASGHGQEFANVLVVLTLALIGLGLASEVAVAGIAVLFGAGIAISLIGAGMLLLGSGLERAAVGFKALENLFNSLNQLNPAQIGMITTSLFGLALALTLFPFSKFNNLVNEFVKLGNAAESIQLIEKSMKELGNLKPIKLNFEGIAETAAELKNFKNIEMPTIDVNDKDLEAVTNIVKIKDEYTNKIITTLDSVKSEIAGLRSDMKTGIKPIVVMNGRRVSEEAAIAMDTYGMPGTVTTRPA